MFLIDDILLFPFKSLLWIFREINNAVEEDQKAEPEAITAKLSELYMMLETEQITEAEFDAAEKILLDRLDSLNEDRSDDDDDDDDEGTDR